MCGTCELHAHDTFLVKVSGGAQQGCTTWQGTCTELPPPPQTLDHIQESGLFDCLIFPINSFGFDYIDETASPSNYNCWFLSGVLLGSGWMHIPPKQAKEIDPRLPNWKNVHYPDPDYRK